MLNTETFVTDMLNKIDSAVLEAGSDKPTFPDVAEELNKAEEEGKRFLKVVDYLKTVLHDRQHFETAKSIKPSDLIEAVETMSRQETERKNALRAKIEAERQFQQAQRNSEIRPIQGA